MVVKRIQVSESVNKEIFKRCQYSFSTDSTAYIWNMLLLFTKEMHYFSAQFSFLYIRMDEYLSLLWKLIYFWCLLIVSAIYWRKAERL